MRTFPSLTAVLGIVLADSVPWRHMSGWGWGMALVGLLLMTAVIALVVWLVVISTRRPDHSTGPSMSNAIKVLEERYARGEIDRDDYLQRRSDLEPR